jgi:hypothetical protein
MVEAVEAVDSSLNGDKVRGTKCAEDWVLESVESE